MTTATEEQIKAELIDLEAKRCKALEGVDRAALAALCDEDLIFVHGQGKIENKEHHVNDIAPRRTVRGDLDIRLYDDIAIMTGPQTNYNEGRDPLHIFITQVWIRRPAGWKLLSFQASGRLVEGH